MKDILPDARNTSILECLEEILNVSENLDGVIILALQKDGSQLLQTSDMTPQEQAFLLSFFQAWMTQWFAL